MSFQIHKKKYVYAHFRENGKVKSIYIGKLNVNEDSADSPHNYDVLSVGHFISRNFFAGKKGDELKGKDAKRWDKIMNRIQDLRIDFQKGKI